MSSRTDSWHLHLCQRAGVSEVEDDPHVRDSGGSVLYPDGA